MNNQIYELQSLLSVIRYAFEIVMQIVQTLLSNVGGSSFCHPVLMDMRELSWTRPIHFMIVLKVEIVKKFAIKGVCFLTAFLST